MNGPCEQMHGPPDAGDDLEAELAERHDASEASLQEHLDRIVAECLEKAPDATAIVLYGSYGRGEGAWYRDSAGRLRPYNDYDVMIVGGREVPAAELAELERSLLAEIGLRWLDIGQKRPEELGQLRPSILNHDLKHASRVIHGDPAVLDRIPEIPAASLPMKEAQVLYFTRLWTFLGSLPAGPVAQPLAGDASRFFRNQMCKAVLAIVDVELLAEGAYHPSYRRRVANLAERRPDDPELLELARWALHEKLVPSDPAMDAAEVGRLYGLVLGRFRDHMYRALTLRFGRKVEGPEDLERELRFRPLSLLKRAYWRARFGSRMEQQIDIQLAQSHLVAAHGDDVRGPARLARATRLLRGLDPALPAELDWDQARCEAARLRLEL